MVTVISSSESSPGGGESSDSGAPDASPAGRVEFVVIWGSTGFMGGVTGGRVGIAPRVGFRSKPSKFHVVCWIRSWHALSSTCKAWMFCSACTILASCPFVFSHRDMNRSDDHSRMEWFSASSRATCPNSSILSRGDPIRILQVSQRWWRVFEKLEGT